MLRNSQITYFILSGVIRLGLLTSLFALTLTGDVEAVGIIVSVPATVLWIIADMAVASED